jgi:ribosomal protein L37AE/L43A
MAGMKKCSKCGKMFELNRNSLELVRPLRIGFFGTVVAACCPHCSRTIEAVHRGEQQTWDAIYEGEIA